MEKMKGIDDRVNLINELLQGIVFAKELRNHFMNPTNATSLASSSSSSSLLSLSDDNNQDQDPNFLLLQKLLSTFDKTISMAKLINFQVNQDYPSINHVDNNNGHLESPHSLTISGLKSENSHTTSKRRRSMMPKWSKKVKISKGGVSLGLEGTLDDGFSWRKYGQKDILGAQFPRAYYRCTHRNSRNCAALKQVQQSDEDSTIYQIMYVGEHTCNQGAHLKKAQLNPISPAQINTEQQPHPPSSPQQEVYVGLGPEGDLKVEPEQDLDNQAHLFPCFSFTQAHQESEPINDSFMLSFCPSFGSPTYQATGDHVGLMVQIPETDINEAVSGPNSVTNSPVMGGSDVEFSLNELLDFGGNFYYEFE